MSNIFNLFGETNVTPRAQQKMGSSDVLGKFPTKTPGRGPLKQWSTPKPKGLSIRSNNDLNVCTPSQKTGNIAKAKLNTLDCAMSPSTARQKETVSKLQVVREKQLKGHTPPSKSPYFNLTLKQKGSEDLLFKKPVTPKYPRRKKHVYPDPECIPAYIDDEFYYNYCYNLESPLVKRREKPIEPWTDEGFESDPDVEPPALAFSPLPSIELPDLDLEEPEIPVVSDSDSDF